MPTCYEMNAVRIIEMNAQRLGIITSLAIHAFFLVLILSLPAVNAIPFMKTITISFARQEASQSAAQTQMKAAVKPQTAEARRADEPEIRETERRQDEATIQEKPATPVPQKAATQTVAKTELTSLGSDERKNVAETAFGNSGAPSFIHREIPIYPFQARRFGKEGTVVLKLHIDKNGYLQSIEVIQPSQFGFTEAAVDAIKKSTFAPAHRKGEKIASKALLSVRFNLK